MSNLIEASWVRAELKQNTSEFILVDCRFTLGKPAAGRDAYKEGHLPGAVYLGLEENLSSPVGAHGGRHPLPDPAKLAQTLGELGIGNSTKVIAYDDQGGAMASRLWWVLRYLGHDQVFVLDNGYSQWVKSGYEVTTEIPKWPSRTFVPHLQQDQLLSMEEVKARLNKTDSVLIDSREAPRYLGKEEAIDKAAGHIPGAKNYFWKEVLTPEGAWKTADELKEQFASLDRTKEIVVYCGSGITACPNVLALTEAGFTHVKLYGGSWSDWISYNDNPIATGEE